MCEKEGMERREIMDLQVRKWCQEETTDEAQQDSLTNVLLFARKLRGAGGKEVEGS